MKGFIVVNAYSNSVEYLYQAKRMQEEFVLQGVVVDIITNDSFLMIIENNRIVSRIPDYDFCIYWDKDKYILTMLEKTGIPVYNPCRAILNCDDKMLTYIELADNDIPIPKTLPGLLCYSEEESVKESTLDIAETLGYPLIIKESFGSLGNELYLVNDRQELKSIMEKVKCRPHLIQEYIETSYGRDVRVIVIGGEVVGGMLRMSDHDFRSNIGSGGRGEVYELTPEMTDIAKRTAKVLGLDYCGIDMLFGKEGPLICEVNSNAFFYTFEKITGINVAKRYVDHIINNQISPE